jgi:hypothetical protein
MSSVPMSATPSIRPIIPKQILDLQLSTHTTFVQPRATVFSVPRFKLKMLQLITSDYMYI